MNKDIEMALTMPSPKTHTLTQPGTIHGGGGCSGVGVGDGEEREEGRGVDGWGGLD